jgi:hypothetical protein
MKQAFLSGILAGLVVAWFPSCGAAARCDATTCATGCCDANQQCRPGTALDACGKGGATCAACTGTSTCSVNACSAGAGGGAGGGATGGGSGGGTAGGGSGGSAGGGAGGGTASSNVVINEICARGCDYLELFNAGNAPADLSNWGLADSDADGGAIKLSEAVRFSAGTTLGAGQYLLVLTKVTDGGTGPTSDCLGSGLAQCWRASYGISNSRGETVWLVNDTDTVTTSVFYPIDGADAGQSYSRLPNGTGNFSTATRTPGALNMP